MGPGISINRRDETDGFLNNSFLRGLGAFEMFLVVWDVIRLFLTKGHRKSVLDVQKELQAS